MLVNRLPQIMAQEEVSIRQLARLTGVTYTTIRAMVHGQRRSIQLDVLDAVCEALGVQPGDIYRRLASGRRQASGLGKASGRRPVTSSRQSEWRTW